MAGPATAQRPYAHAHLGDLPVTHLTRERLIKYGRDRAHEGAGPATLAIDISFIGTILTPPP